MSTNLEPIERQARAVTMRRCAVIIVVNVLIQIALMQGWLTHDMSDQTVALTTQAIDFLSAVVAGLYVQRGFRKLEVGVGI